MAFGYCALFYMKTKTFTLSYHYQEKRKMRLYCITIHKVIIRYIKFLRVIIATAIIRIIESSVKTDLHNAVNLFK